jgi:hypothetical protein
VHPEDVRRLLFHWKDNQLMQMQVVMALTNASLLERVVLQLTQACMYAVFVAVFACSRRFGCRLCGYMLEESTVMLTHMVNDIDMEKVRADVKVPHVAMRYWGLDVRGMRPFVTPVSTADTRVPSDDSQNKDSATTHDNTAVAELSTRPLSQPSGAPIQQGETLSTLPVGGNEVAVVALRDVVLLMRADDMCFRDLLHAVANKIDDARDRRPGDKMPRSPFS